MTDTKPPGRILFPAFPWSSPPSITSQKFADIYGLKVGLSFCDSSAWVAGRGRIRNWDRNAAFSSHLIYVEMGNFDEAANERTRKRKKLFITFLPCKSSSSSSLPPSCLLHSARSPHFHHAKVLRAPLPSPPQRTAPSVASSPSPNFHGKMRFILEF